MQIVIDIPKEIYRDTIAHGIVFDEYNWEMASAVRNGTVLPKHRGRLIDTDVLKEHLVTDGCDVGCGYIDERDISNIPTVLSR